MKASICFAFCIACGLLTGCVRFQPQPLSPAKSAKQLEERSLDNPGLKKFVESNLHREFTNWPAASWDLDMLTLAAFYYQPELEVARAQWHAAQAGIKTAAARPNPTLSVTPGYNFSHINAAPNLTPWFPAATLDVPLETAGKRSKRIAVARKNSEAARLNIASMAWQVRSNLRSSMLDYTAAGLREDLLRQQLGFQEQIVALLAQRLQAGAISSSELAITRVTLEKTRLDLNDMLRQRAESRQRIAEAVGVPINALKGIELTVDGLNLTARAVELSSAQVRRQALVSRSDILGALADYAASQAALELEIAKQYPDVRLSPGYQYDQGDNKWSLGLSVDLPVLNRNQGPIAEAKARRTEAAARFNAVQAKALAEIDHAVEMYRVTETTVSTLQSLAAAQRTQRDSVQAQFQVGAADRLDLVNAQFEYSAGEIVRLDSQIKLQQTLGLLEDAVQRPIFGSMEAQPDSRAVMMGAHAEEKGDKP